MSGSPEEILRGALEKIVFFECRVEQLESELRAARASAGRAREEAAEARRRESEAGKLLASSRADADAARAEVADLSERVKLLEEERGRFLGGLVERARVAGAPAAEGEPPADGADLAGFIAELRAEIDRLSRIEASARAAGLVVEGAERAGPSLAGAAGGGTQTLPRLAARFAESGRARLGEGEAASLAPSFATRSERSLYLSSLEDLSAPDAPRRRRAAACLRALGSKAAVPVLAAALGREADGEARAAIVATLGALGERSAADLVTRELGDARPAVRAAALEAASALLGEDSLPALQVALGDESPSVRRRAAVLLGFLRGGGAEEALASALADGNAGVARAAAVALSGRPSTRAQATLARALDHREPEVRRAAARAVERWAGERVDAGAAPADRRRASRRIAEKLQALDPAALRGAVTRVAEPPGPRPAAAPTSIAMPLPAPIATPAPAALPTPAAAPAAAPSRVAVLEPDPALADLVLAEVRTALRGRTPGEIADALRADPGAVEGVLRALVAQGRLAPRGPRFFMS